MPMYKDSDITAALIQEKFPDVAASIVQSSNAGGADTLSVDTLKVNHPHIANALFDEGKASANAEKMEAIKAEQTRILAILALGSVGCESIIQAALDDSSMSVESVKVKLFDAMQTKTASHFDAHKKDGESLGADLKSLGSGENQDESNESDEEKALKAMSEAGKIARGE